MKKLLDGDGTKSNRLELKVVGRISDGMTSVEWEINIIQKISEGAR